MFKMNMAEDYFPVVFNQGFDDLAQMKTPVLGKIKHKKGWPHAL